MANKKPADYRLKITSPQGESNYTTFFIRRAGRTAYLNGSETPLALANLVSDAAAALRFQLEDATDGQQAAKALRDVLTEMWKNNAPRCPKVEVL